MITYWLSGAVLDREGAPRRRAEHVYQYGSASAELATDGRDYLMVWPAANGAWARTISAGGDSVDAPIQVVSNLRDAVTLRVVWNGEAYAVAASTNSTTTITLVSPAGRVIASGAIANDGALAALSPAGRGRVLALLRTQTGTESVIVDGVKGEAAVSLPIASGALDLVAATSGSEFLAVWRDSGRIVGLPLDARGAPSGSAITIAADAIGPATDVVWEHDNYLVLWSGSGVEAARVATDGAVSPRFQVAAGSLASAAFNSRGTIILSRAGCASIQSTFLALGAAEGTALDVSLAAVPQSGPQIVRTPAGHQLFWSEPSALMSSFVTPDGAISPAKRINADASAVIRSVAVRAGDATFAIWTDYPNGQLPGTLRATRFDASGNQVDSIVINKTWFIFGLSAETNGSDVIVTWTQQSQTGARFEVYASRLSATGTIEVPPTPISIPSDDVYAVVVGADGDRAIIGWRNGANTLVAVEVGARLETLSRREIAVPESPVVFPVAAGIHDNRSLIVWWAVDATSILRLHATDPATGHDATLDRAIQSISFSARVLARGDEWLIYFSENQSASMATAVQRSVLRGTAFGDVETLQCAPGDIAYTLSGDRVGAMLYSAPAADIEGAWRLFFRNVFPSRRRAAR